MMQVERRQVEEIGEECRIYATIQPDLILTKIQSKIAERQLAFERYRLNSSRIKNNNFKLLLFTVSICPDTTN
jgi:hypothetical protein